jgi:hypothetical protein
MDDIRLIERGIVDEDAFIPYLQLVIGESNHPLDEIPPLIFRVLEDEDVSPLRGGEMIDELIDQDMISDLESGKHRAGRNLEGLYDEGPDNESQNEGNDDRFCIFSEGRFFLLGPFQVAHLTNAFYSDPREKTSHQAGIQRTSLEMPFSWEAHFSREKDEYGSGGPRAYPETAGSPIPSQCVIG